MMRNYFEDSNIEFEANRLRSLGELNLGDTRRFCHATCGDTRGRGYLSCKPGHSGGEVDLFYCHNCGESAVRSGRSSLRYLPRTIEEEEKTDDSAPTIPGDAVPVLADEVPALITDWAKKYRVANDVLWSPSMERIIMPVAEPFDGDFLGYQARRHPHGSVKIPKYITMCSRIKPLWLLVPPNTYLMAQPNTVVFVEDWISAHQFRDLTAVWGAGLLGLNATAEYVLWVDQQVQTLTGSIPDYLVWLDNDVKKSFEIRDYLQRLLRTLGRKVRIETSLNDPKNHSEQVVSDTIRFMMTGAT